MTLRRRAQGRAVGPLFVFLGCGAVAFAAREPAAEAQVAAAADTTMLLERLEPALHAAAVGVPSSDVLARGEWLAFALLGALHEPLVLRDLDSGEVVSRPVQDRVALQLGVARGLGKRYQLGARAPAVAWQRGDRLRGIGIDETALQSVVLGDLTLEGRARLVGERGQGGAAVGVSVAVTLPTGADEHFAGEAGAVIDWRLLAGYRHRDGEVAAYLGPRLRGTESVLLTPAAPQGNELVYGVGGNLRLPFGSLDLVRLAVELVGVRGDAVRGGSHGPSPVELRGAVKGRVGPAVSLLVGGGAGLTGDELGSPAWRAFVGLEWQSARATDADGDGVADPVDRCPLRAGSLGGCPPTF